MLGTNFIPNLKTGVRVVVVTAAAGDLAYMEQAQRRRQRAEDAWQLGMRLGATLGRGQVSSPQRAFSTVPSGPLVPRNTVLAPTGQRAQPAKRSKHSSTDACGYVPRMRLICSRTVSL